MKFATSFQSQRFTFSPICEKDGLELFEAVSDEKFPSELYLSSLHNEKAARAWCVDRVHEWALGTAYVWSCRESENSALLGQISLSHQEDCLALAYWVNPLSWGKGIATEICRALFLHLSLSGYQGKIWAGVHTWNVSSEHILQKLGFELLLESKDIKEYLLLLEM